MTISRSPSSPSSARTRCARSGRSPLSSASSSSLCCIHERAYRGRLSIPPVRKEGGSSVTLEIGDRAGVMRLGEVLRSAGYDPDRMRPMLRAREDDNIAPQPSDIPVILRLLPNGEPLAGLMKLLLLGVDVPEDEARSALAPLPVERAIALGVVRRVGGSVAANVRILPVGRFVFASDLALERSPDVAPDHVMSIAGSSIHLASLTVRRHVRRPLASDPAAGFSRFWARWLRTRSSRATSTHAR